MLNEIGMVWNLRSYKKELNNNDNDKINYIDSEKITLKKSR